MNAQSFELLGRRERNKQDKLARITEAACRLIGERGIGDVTTLQVAEAADVATGTLFLYAKTKGELLLLAQNAEYESALRQGKSDASRISNKPVEAVVALWKPVIDCNRKHVENGRAYLKEVVFGDSNEVNHKVALALMAETEAETAKLFMQIPGQETLLAKERAKSVSAVIFLLLASPMNVTKDAQTLAAEFAVQLELMFKH